MRTSLLALALLILVLMLAVTVWASVDRSVWSAGYLFDEPWFVATFVDAYCGFFLFSVWVAYKEQRAVPRVAWLVAILSLGNLATAAYLLVQLWRLREGESWEHLLLRR